MDSKIESVKIIYANDAHAEFFLAELEIGGVPMEKAGLVIATADLLIGITALPLDYMIGTRKVRQFNRIPGLQVFRLLPPLPAGF